MADISDIEFAISRFDLRPEDILVVRCKQILSREQIERMRTVFTKISPNNKLMVLDSGLDLAVLTAADIESRTAD